MLDHVLWFEVFEGVEIEFNTQLRAVLRQSVVDAVGQARLDALEHAVEVVAVDENELAVLELRQRLQRVAGEIAQHTDDKGQLFLFLSVADIHVIGDMDPRRANAVEFVLGTFLLRHRDLLCEQFAASRLRVGSMGAERVTFLRSSAAGADGFHRSFP
ncbi:hypothetical protein D3C73_1101760 [compost metagenome]